MSDICRLVTAAGARPPLPVSHTSLTVPRGPGVGPLRRHVRRARGNGASRSSLGPVVPLRPRNLVLVVLGRQPTDEFVELVTVYAVRRSPDVLVCRAVEVPETVPLDVRRPVPDDESLLESLRASLAARGIRVSTELVQTRDAGAALLELARTLRPRVILLNGVRTPRGRLSREAACLLRGASGAQLIIFEA